MKMKKRYVFLVLFLTTLIVASLNFFNILEYIADNYLTIRDKLEKADVIIVISGGMEDERINKAISLYQIGYANKIIFSGGMITKRLSIVDLWVEMAEKMGINKGNIFMQRDAKSTYDSVGYSADIMTKNGFRKAIVVTSPYHSRRTKYIFDKVFKTRDLSIIMGAVDRSNSNVNKNGYPRHEVLLEEVVFELQKLAYYKLFH